MVVDDHPIVLRALSDLFETEGGLEVVATCTSGEEALARVGSVNPDVLIVDLKLPDLDGIGVLKRLKSDDFQGRILFLTAQMDDTDALEVVRLGGDGIVFKDQAPEDLVTAVLKVAQGERWLPSGTMERALDAALRREATGRDSTSHLTPRETEVCRLVALGHSNKRIARELDITEGTVKVHLTNIFQKLDVSSRLQVALAARSQGIL